MRKDKGPIALVALFLVTTVCIPGGTAVLTGLALSTLFITIGIVSIVSFFKPKPAYGSN